MDLALFNCTCGPLTKKGESGKDSSGQLPCIARILKEKTDRKRRRKLKGALQSLVVPGIEIAKQEGWLVSLAAALNTLAKFEISLASTGEVDFGLPGPLSPDAVLVRLDDVVNELSTCNAVDAIAQLLLSEAPLVACSAVECLTFLFRLSENAEHFMADSGRRASLLRLLGSSAPIVTRIHAANALAMAIAVAYDAPGLSPEHFALRGDKSATGGGKRSMVATWRDEEEPPVIEVLVDLARTATSEVEAEAKGEYSQLMLRFIQQSCPDHLQLLPDAKGTPTVLASSTATMARCAAVSCLSRVVGSTCRDGPKGQATASQRRQMLLERHGESLLKLFVDDILSPTSLTLAGDECLCATWQSGTAVAAARALACLCSHTFPVWQQASAVEPEESVEEEEDDFVLVDVAKDIRAACTQMEGEAPVAEFVVLGDDEAARWTLEGSAPAIFSAAEASLSALQRRCKGKGVEALQEVAPLQAVTALLMDCLANLTQRPSIAEKLGSKGSAAMRLASAVRVVAELLSKDAAKDTVGGDVGVLRRALCEVDRVEAFHSCVPGEGDRVSDMTQLEVDAMVPQCPLPRKPGQKFTWTRDILHHTPPSYASMLIALANLALFTSTSMLPDYFSSSVIQQADVARQRGNLALSTGDHSYARWWYSTALRLAHSASAQVGGVYVERHLLWSNRAESCLRARMFTEALRDAEQALVLEPNHLKSMLRRQRALQGLGETEEPVPRALMQDFTKGKQPKLVSARAS